MNLSCAGSAALLVVQAVCTRDQPGDQEVTVRQFGDPGGYRLGGRLVGIGISVAFVAFQLERGQRIGCQVTRRRTALSRLGRVSASTRRTRPAGHLADIVPAIRR